MGLTLVGRDVPRDADAEIEVVVAFVGVGAAHGFHHARFGVGEHAEVVVTEVAGAGIGHLKRDAHVEQTGVVQQEITRFEVHRRAATHTVVAILVVAMHLIRRVEQGLLVVNLDASAEVAQAGLHENTAVGVGPERKQLAHLPLQVKATLVDLESGDIACATNDFAINGGDAFAKNLHAVDVHSAAKNEIAVGRQQPVRCRLVDKATAHVMGDAIQILGVECRQLEGVPDLEHGHGDRLFHDVFGLLGQRIGHDAEQEE